ncbi:Breast cancer 2, early onset, partial [Nowakowskiella sp. JEL0078]
MAENYCFDDWGHVQARIDLITHGGDPKLATEDWVRNHYKSIVWKNACLVRSFPSLKNRWGKHTILDGLRYRYEVEINQAHFSCLKRIIEQDNSSSLHMVLCVSRIFRTDEKDGIDDEDENISNQGGVVELTDGWYFIRAHLDEVLKQAVSRGMITVGQKLHICGARLQASGPCSPLEIKSSTFLLLNANGTRRARWNAKLGYQRNTAFTIGLKNISPTGGIVAVLDVVICRKYPVMYYEKTLEEQSVFRNEGEEEIASREYQNETNDLYQKLYLEGEKRIYKQASIQKEENSWIQKNLEEMKIEVMDQLMEQRPNRSVRRVLKLRVCDYPPDETLNREMNEAFLT